MTPHCKSQHVMKSCTGPWCTDILFIL